MNTNVNREIAIQLNNKWYEFKYLWSYIEGFEKDSEKVKYYPTIAETIMWLYEKHNIWIVVNIDKPHLSNSCMFYGNVIKFGLHHKNKHRTIFYNTPTEAYLSAILLTLQKLI